MKGRVGGNSFVAKPSKAESSTGSSQGRQSYRNKREGRIPASLSNKKKRKRRGSPKKKERGERSRIGQCSERNNKVQNFAGDSEARQAPFLFRRSCEEKGEEEGGKISEGKKGSSIRSQKGRPGLSITD